MRKLSILSIFFLFFLLFLNGCGNFKEKDNDYFEKKQDFSISANCKQNATNYKMKIEKNGSQIKLTYLSPKYASGLTFLFNTETDSASYTGLEMSRESETLFKTTTPAAISKAIQDYMSRPGENIEATTEYGDYQAKIDKTSGLPKMLKLKNQNFSCSFD